MGETGKYLGEENYITELPQDLSLLTHESLEMNQFFPLNKSHQLKGYSFSGVLEK